MRKFLFIYLLTISPFLYAQQTFHERKLELVVGASTNGTGDMKGVSFATKYGETFKKRLSWTVEIGGTVHDGAYPLFFTDPSGNSIDGSIRYATAGIQVIGDIGYSIIKSGKQEFKVVLGPLLRYQSSSYYDILDISYPAGTGLPEPVITFQNLTPQRTFAVGGSGQFQYNYIVSTKLTIGIVAGLQTDTNGDIITQLGLAVGRRF